MDRLPNRGPLACLFLSMALFATDSAEGQALNPTWHGEWRKQSANIADADSPALRITGGTPTRLVTGSQVCALAYDGTVTRQQLLDRMRALQDWQLNPANWPAGTDTRLLVGLRREFDDALQLLQGLPADAYRRVRLAGPDCSTPDDRFLALSNQGRSTIYAIRFPAANLGVSVSLYRRGP